MASARELPSCICLYIVCVLGIVSFSNEQAIAQQKGVGQWMKKTLRRYINDTIPPEKSHFLLYPTLAFSPETSLEIGFSSLLLFHAKNNVLENRLSEIQAFTFITLERQYGIWLDHAIYGNQDRWFFLGRVRFQQFPLLYYGIGPNTPVSEPAIVGAGSVIIRERILKKIIPDFFIGLETDFQQLFQVDLHQPAGYTIPPPLGIGGSANLGLGAGLVYDNRHNVLNVRKGFFSEIAFLNYRKMWGSSFDFHSLTFDTRFFRPLGKQVLALQAYGSFLSGDIPFNQLALLGGDMMMRGYYAGRYRDSKYIASQIEYRWLPFPFSKRVGGVIFAAAGGVAPTLSAFSARNIIPAGGAGVRYLLFPRKDIFLRFDVGITREGAGFYIYTGEAF